MQDDITPTPSTQRQPVGPAPFPSAPVEPDAFAAPVANSSVEPTTSSANAPSLPVAPVGPIGSGESASASMPPSPQPSLGKKKKMIIGSIIAGALIVLGGGGAAAYNLWYQNPDKVLGDALVNMLSAKSVIFKSTIDINLKDSGQAAQGMPTKVTVSLDGKGSYDSGSQLDVKLQTKLNKKDVTLSGSGIVDKDQNLYIKVNDMKKTLDDTGYGAAMPPEYASVIKSIDSKWIKISAEDLKKQNKDLSKTQTCINDAVKKLREDKAQTKELLELYKKHAFVVVKDKLGSKDGSLGYAVDFDEDKGKSFGEGLKDTTIYKELDKCDPSSSDEVDSDFTPTSEKDTDDESFEIWVSRFGHEFTSLKATSKPTDSTSIVTSAEVNVSSEFNKPVNVVAPSVTIPLSKVIADFEAAQEKYMKRVYAQYYKDAQQTTSTSQVSALPTFDNDTLLSVPSL